jgi:hypothetical protein
MTTAVILIVLVLLVAAALVAFVVNRRKQEREALRERFGPEYDRAVEERGDRREAEHHLSDVASHRDKAEIRELRPEERERYSSRWADVQAAFVDDPVTATRDADDLVGTVMRDRGYPLDDVEDRGDLVAADHAELAHHYRSAHATGSRAHEASTEELRQAFVHYRALFTELLGTPDGRHSVAGPGAAAAATHAEVTTDDVTRATDDRGAMTHDRTDMTDRSELDGQQQLDLTESERTRTAPGRETPPA